MDMWNVGNYLFTFTNHRSIQKQAASVYFTRLTWLASGFVKSASVCRNLWDFWRLHHVPKFYPQLELTSEPAVNWHYHLMQTRYIHNG